MGGARNERQHDDGEGHGARKATLLMAYDQQSVDEDADDDRRQTRQDVHDDLDSDGKTLRSELGEIDRDQHTDRQRDRGREPDDERRTDNRVRDSAARAPEEIRLARQEVPA